MTTLTIDEYINKITKNSLDLKQMILAMILHSFGPQTKAIVFFVLNFEKSALAQLLNAQTYQGNVKESGIYTCGNLKGDLALKFLSQVNSKTRFDSNLKEDVARDYCFVVTRPMGDNLFYLLDHKKDVQCVSIELEIEKEKVTISDANELNIWLERQFE